MNYDSDWCTLTDSGYDWHLLDVPKLAPDDFVGRFQRGMREAVIAIVITAIVVTIGWAWTSQLRGATRALSRASGQQLLYQPALLSVTFILYAVGGMACIGVLCLPVLTRAIFLQVYIAASEWVVLDRALWGMWEALLLLHNIALTAILPIGIVHWRLQRSTGDGHAVLQALRSLGHAISATALVLAVNIAWRVLVEHASTPAAAGILCAVTRLLRYQAAPLLSAFMLVWALLFARGLRRLAVRALGACVRAHHADTASMASLHRASLQKARTMTNVAAIALTQQVLAAMESSALHTATLLTRLQQLTAAARVAARLQQSIGQGVGFQSPASRTLSPPMPADAPSTGIARLLVPPTPAAKNLAVMSPPPVASQGTTIKPAHRLGKVVQVLLPPRARAQLQAARTPGATLLPARALSPTPGTPAIAAVETADTPSCASRSGDSPPRTAPAPNRRVHKGARRALALREVPPLRPTTAEPVQPAETRAARPTQPCSPPLPALAAAPPPPRSAALSPSMEQLVQFVKLSSYHKRRPSNLSLASSAAQSWDSAAGSTSRGLPRRTSIAALGLASPALPRSRTASDAAAAMLDSESSDAQQLAAASSPAQSSDDGAGPCLVTLPRREHGGLADDSADSALESLMPHMHMVPVPPRAYPEPGVDPWQPDSETSLWAAAAMPLVLDGSLRFHAGNTMTASLGSVRGPSTPLQWTALLLATLPALRESANVAQAAGQVLHDAWQGQDGGPRVPLDNSAAVLAEFKRVRSARQVLRYLHALPCVSVLGHAVSLAPVQSPVIAASLARAKRHLQLVHSTFALQPARRTVADLAAQGLGALGFAGLLAWTVLLCIHASTMPFMNALHHGVRAVGLVSEAEAASLELGVDMHPALMAARVTWEAVCLGMMGWAVLAGLPERAWNVSDTLQPITLSVLRAHLPLGWRVALMPLLPVRVVLVGLDAMMGPACDWLADWVGAKYRLRLSRTSAEQLGLGLWLACVLSACTLMAAAALGVVTQELHHVVLEHMPMAAQWGVRYMFPAWCVVSVAAQLGHMLAA